MQIKKINGEILYSREASTIKITVEKAVKERVSLHKADLRDADLTEADISEASLNNADLRGADLRGADLRWANLRGADLMEADLRDADFMEVSLGGADLSGANLRGVNLRGVDLSEAEKIPMHCIWDFGVTNDLINIGCKEMSIDEWDAFFASDEEFQTPRDTDEFKQIEAVYRGYKAYIQFLNNYEKI